jgi:hypothetical protein
MRQMCPEREAQLVRLNKIEGQLKGICGMIEERRCCVDMRTPRQRSGPRPSGVNKAERCRTRSWDPTPALQRDLELGNDQVSSRTLIEYRSEGRRIEGGPAGPRGTRKDEVS